MKIVNPWPHHPHTRCFCKPGDSVLVVGAGPEIEIPDGCEEVLIEALDRGHSMANVVAQGRVWSKKWGMLDVPAYAMKMKLEEDVKEMAALKEKEASKRLEEAKAKAKAKMEEKPAPKD